MAHDTVLVTGGSTGIGAAICDTFLKQGTQVVNLSRRPLERPEMPLINIQLDLSDRNSTERVAADIAKNYSITGFVHNAGLIRPALLSAVSLDDYDYLSQVHIGAAITLTQAILPSMRERQFGRIILITSRAALGLQTRTIYSATKSGMIGLARTWALELAPEGITVNTVAPGPIADTEMFESVVPADSDKAEQIAKGIPVQRLGRSKDVAHAVQFLSSEDSGFITGQTLMVCGGASLGSLAL